MALTVEVSKNVEDYQESVVAGLNTEKSIYAFLAFVVGAILMAIFILLFKIDIVVSAWIATPFIGLVILFGFYTKDGLTFKQILYRKRYNKYNKPNHMINTENSFKSYQEVLQKEKEQHDKENNNKQEFEHTMMLLKKFTIIGIAAVSLFITLIIILKLL